MLLYLRSLTVCLYAWDMWFDSFILEIFDLMLLYLRSVFDASLLEIFDLMLLFLRSFIWCFYTWDLWFDAFYTWDLWFDAFMLEIFYLMPFILEIFDLMLLYWRSLIWCFYTWDLWFRWSKNATSTTTAFVWSCLKKTKICKLLQFTDWIYVINIVNDRKFAWFEMFKSSLKWHPFSVTLY